MNLRPRDLSDPRPVANSRVQTHKAATAPKVIGAGKAMATKGAQGHMAWRGRRPSEGKRVRTSSCVAWQPDAPAEHPGSGLWSSVRSRGRRLEGRTRASVPPCLRARVPARDLTSGSRFSTCHSWHLAATPAGWLLFDPPRTVRHRSKTVPRRNCPWMKRRVPPLLDAGRDGLKRRTGLRSHSRLRQG